MSKKISIAIDAMGGDNSPDKTLNGIKMFIDRNLNKDDFILNIFGKEDIIKDKIKKLNINTKSINIIHSDTIVSDEETPLTAIKSSKNTSMWNCIKHQQDGKSDISLSAGNICHSICCLLNPNFFPKDKTAESLSPLNKLNEKSLERNLLSARKASFLT